MVQSKAKHEILNNGGRPDTGAPHRDAPDQVSQQHRRTGPSGDQTRRRRLNRYSFTVTQDKQAHVPALFLAGDGFKHACLVGMHALGFGERAIGLHLVELCAGADRADGRALATGDLHLIQSDLQAAHELVVDRSLDQAARTGRTRLPGVEQEGLYRARNRQVKIGVRKDNVWRLAAHLRSG